MSQACVEGEPALLVDVRHMRASDAQECSRSQVGHHGWSSISTS